MPILDIERILTN